MGPEPRAEPGASSEQSKGPAGVHWLSLRNAGSGVGEFPFQMLEQMREDIGHTRSPFVPFCIGFYTAEPLKGSRDWSLATELPLLLFSPGLTCLPVKWE